MNFVWNAEKSKSDYGKNGKPSFSPLFKNDFKK
jgi:hypothetical protein